MAAMPKPALTRPNAPAGMAQVSQWRVHGRSSTASGVSEAEVWPVGDVDGDDDDGDDDDADGDDADDDDADGDDAAATSSSRRRLPVSSRIATRAPEGSRARRSVPKGAGVERM